MIKFFDLQLLNQSYEKAFHQKLQNVFDKGWYILGKEVQTFESNFAHFCGTKHCIGVGNGLDALLLILKGYIQLGIIKKGDEIIIRNGEIIPADALLVEGSGHIDYSFVTGESDTVDIRPGKEVFAGGRQVGEQLRIRIEKQFSQSYLMQLWKNENKKDKN